MNITIDNQKNDNDELEQGPRLLSVVPVDLKEILENNLDQDVQEPGELEQGPRLLSVVPVDLKELFDIE